MTERVIMHLRKEQLSADDLNIAYWDNFYANNSIQGESTFCNYIKGVIDNNSIVLDVGCGSGRDSFAFARSGYDVVGIDRSEEAIKTNRKTCENWVGDSKGSLRFNWIDIGDSTELSSCFEELCRNAKRSKKKIVVYLRFLLHAINEATEEVLLSVASNYLRNGDYLAAEFRTIEDKARVKTFNDHYRRFIVAEDLMERLERNGSFQRVEFFKGTGLSVFNNEDPYLARMIMIKK